MEWISVEDRLPQRGGTTVLVATTVGTEADLGWYDVDTCEWYESESGETFEKLYGPSCVVTHWMPLPELPC